MTQIPDWATETATDLVRSWEHGDEAHRQWLRDVAIQPLAQALRDASGRSHPESTPKSITDCRYVCLIPAGWTWAMGPSGDVVACHPDHPPQVWNGQRWEMLVFRPAEEFRQ